MIRGPQSVAIDASGDEQSVLKVALEAMEYYGIDIHTIADNYYKYHAHDNAYNNKSTIDNNNSYSNSNNESTMNLLLSAAKSKDYTEKENNNYYHNTCSTITTNKKVFTATEENADYYCNSKENSFEINNSSELNLSTDSNSYGNCNSDSFYDKHSSFPSRSNKRVSMGVYGVLGKF